MVWKGEGEKQHSMSSNCSFNNVTKAWGWRPGGHIAIIVSNTVQDKALAFH